MIYVYLIQHISSQGMLDKTSWIVRAPVEFSGLQPGH